MSDNQETTAFIRGMGAYLPEKTVTSLELEERLGLEKGWIEKKTGIAGRRVAAEGECVSDLVAAAGRRAIRDAGLTAGDLDMILVSSSMGDMFFPSTACLVQNKIEAACPAFDVSNACSGFIYSLATAAAFIRSGQCRNVLVAGGETMSRMVDWSNYKTCILFGDGAGACIVSAEGDHRFMYFYLGADGSGAEVLKLPGGGSRHPASKQMLDEGLNTVYMEGGEVFRFAMKIIGECLQRVSEKAGIAPASINTIIPHQSNMSIIREAAKILGVPVDRFHMNMKSVGNTAAASVPLALVDAVENGKLSAGDTVALVSYGAGLAYAASLIEW